MTMTPEPPPEHGPLPSLPADRTFVVQFSASLDNPADGVDRGRVEHLVSGLATRFHSWDELRGFVERTLPPAEPDGAGAST